MSFEEATAYLEKAYDSHGQLVFMQETLGRVAVVGGQRNVRRNVPLLSGPPGVGKTSCATGFAGDRGLAFGQ